MSNTSVMESYGTIREILHIIVIIGTHILKYTDTTDTHIISTNTVILISHKYNQLYS